MRRTKRRRRETARFWITDFSQIDPHLGTNAELVHKAHRAGMKVFFDIITNHTTDIIQYLDRGSGVAVRDAGSARLDRHLHDRCRRLLAVQLFLDVGGREDLHLLTVVVVLVRRIQCAGASAIPAASVSSARNMVVPPLSCAFHRVPGSSTRTIHRPDSTGSVQDSRLALLLGAADGQEIR